ncbi:MAG: hypothetical protein J7K88_00875 [Candidatus Fermentibacteraceae bacterium]|nr:hypothetical protein [Candidatus Fermentibacteraceae bacterium]
MKTVVVLLLVVVSAYAETVFVENDELWSEIDRINLVLESSEEIQSAALESLFQEAVEIAVSNDLSVQFEYLRTDAFETDDFTVCDSYAARAGDALNVFILGESNTIGVNTTTFLDACKPESEAYRFFLVAVGGFYTDGEAGISGTAEFPVWIERTDSSAQGAVDTTQAEEWLGYWEGIIPSLDGYFLTIAEETVQGLNLILEQ